MLGAAGAGTYHDHGKSRGGGGSGGLGSALKCRCLPSWMRLRRTKLEVLLILALVAGAYYQQTREAEVAEDMANQQALSDAFELSAAYEPPTLHAAPPAHPTRAACCAAGSSGRSGRSARRRARGWSSSCTR